ncbi:MAG: Hpt domain-containing protein [Pseudomonadota bacterium]
MDLDARLIELRRQYVAQLPKKFSDIEALWRQLRTQDDPQQRADLHRLTHSLAGSGATYGFPNISTAARHAEDILKPHSEAQGQPLPASQIEDALRSLGKVIGEAKSQG